MGDNCTTAGRNFALKIVAKTLQIETS